VTVNGVLEVNISRK